MAKVCMSSFSAEDAENVYDPQEDSYLFCDALTKDTDALSAVKYPLIMEIGSGSGIVSAHALLTLANIECDGFAFCLDINPLACAATSTTLSTNNISNGDCINVDATKGQLSRFHGKIDILLFNPPYVPTPSEEIGWGGLAAAWAGGEDGREVIDKILPLFPLLLSKPSGKAYMVLVQDNKPAEIARILATMGLKMVKVVSTRAKNELLYIFRIEWA